MTANHDTAFKIQVQRELAQEARLLEGRLRNDLAMRDLETAALASGHAPPAMRLRAEEHALFDQARALGY